MGVDRHVLGGVFVKEELLICLREVKLRKLLPTGQCCEEVFWLGERVLVHIYGLIDRDLVVATNAELPILLGDWHDRRGPLAVFDFLDHPASFQLVKLFLDTCLDSKRYRAGFEKSWAGVLSDLQGCSILLDFPYFVFE